MRQVYALLGLVKRWGADRVEAACSRALSAEAVDVGLIGRMLERATESAPAAAVPAAPSPAGPARFSRDREHFSTPRGGQQRSPSGDGQDAGGAA